MQEGSRPSTPVDFGMAISTNEPWPILERRARRLDATPAVSGLWVFDERFERDPWLTLGMLGAATERVTLGPSVTDPFIRHPALTATAAATLDEASGGRAILGLGAGVSGFAALGIERRAPATAMRDAIGFMRRFWTSPEAFSDERATLAFHDARLSFGPVRPVPIAVAGRGPRILSLAGELADTVLVATFSQGPLLDQALARVDEGRSRRDPALGTLRLGSWVYVSVDADRGAARDAVREGIAVAVWGSRPIIEELGLEIPAELGALMDRRAYAHDPEVISEAAALIPEDLIDACSIAGTPEECRQRFDALVARGFDDIVIWPFAPAGGSVDAVIDDLADEVIPSTSGVGAA